MSKTATRKTKAKADKTPLSAVTTAITDTPLVDPPTYHPVVAEKIAAGHIMSITHYVRVREIELKQGQWVNGRAGRDQMGVTGLDKGTKDFDVFGRTLMEGMISADYFAEERVMSRTDVCEQLVHKSGKDPFTVVFDKEDGTERTLRGRFVSEDRFFGRSNVIDLDIPLDPNPKWDNRMRQVTHLNVKSLILRGIKYVVKGK